MEKENWKSGHVSCFSPLLDNLGLISAPFVSSSHHSSSPTCENLSSSPLFASSFPFPENDCCENQITRVCVTIFGEDEVGG
jgi:hypothetical protein